MCVQHFCASMAADAQVCIDILEHKVTKLKKIMKKKKQLLLILHSYFSLYYTDSKPVTGTKTYRVPVNTTKSTLIVLFFIGGSFT